MRKFGLMCTAAMLFGAGSAGAGVLAPGFSGYSVFGNPCPLCDAVVNFTVYENTDGDWTDDAYFSGVGVNPMADLNSQFGASVDSSARYVYMYQPTNKDSTPGLDNPIGNLSVTMKPGRLANITGAGYFGGVFVGEAGQTVDANPHFELDAVDLTTYVADVPGDQTPNRSNEPSLGLTTTTTAIVNPIGVTTGNLISTPVFPGQFFNGIQYNYGNGIRTGSSSSTVFFTTNNRPGYEWGETESSGGTGALGDVPAPVPVPAGAVLIGTGVALTALLGRVRRSKTAV